MKRLSILSAVCGLLFTGAAGAANVTLYHSPSCPHCHHARDFIGGKLVYEYPTISAEAVNVTSGSENFKAFESALKKCNYASGGIPLIVVGDKCFQGYAPEMDQELRDAAAADLSDADKATAKANQTSMEKDAEKFKTANVNRANVIVERDVTATTDAQKKTEKGSLIYFYGLLIVLVVGLGLVLIRKKK